jgi:hypothetical protein
MSSAYIRVDISCVSGISFIYKMNSNGPKADPWGTPYLTGRLLGKYSFI